MTKVPILIHIYRSKCCGAECYRLIDRLVTDDDFYRAVGKDQHTLRCDVCDKPCEVEEKEAK